MGEFALEGDELKKLIKVAKKRPIAFAFSPGSGDDDAIFALHRKRKPDILGKAVKKEGEGSKIAYGLCEVQGKNMTLTCERECPQLAKRLKRWLKAQKAPHNVICFDESGNQIDSDVEDLPDDPMYDEPGVDDEEDEDDAGQGGLDAKELEARLRKITQEAAALPPEKNKQLLAALKSAVTALKGGNLPTVKNTLDAVEQAMGKMAGGPSKEDLQRQRDLAAELGKCRKDMAGRPDIEKLQIVWDMAAKMVKAQDFGRAQQTLEKLKEALAKAPAASPEETLWQQKGLPHIQAANEAIKAGHGDVSRLQAAVAYAMEAAASGDFKKAMATAERLAKAIQQLEASGDTRNEAERTVDANVVPFRQARVLWSKAKAKLNSELSKLQSEIIKACAGIPELSGVENDTKILFSYLEALDERLEDQLDELINAESSEARNKLKDVCRKTIREYLGELESEFFRDVDNNNGFTKVQVRATAVAALNEVERQLAA